TPLATPDVLSPVALSGVDDIATTVPGGLSDFYGTSAASASLAGVAALILSANPNLTPSEVEAIMEATALPMANPAGSRAGLSQVNPAVTDSLVSYLTVSSGQSLQVSSQVTAFGDTLNGGTQYVESGATASGTTVAAGGIEYVLSGGTASTTTIDNGGVEFDY